MALYTEVLSDWFEKNKENIVEALLVINRDYEPSEDNYSAQVRNTMQQLADWGKGLRFLTKYDQIGSVYNFNPYGISGLLDTNRLAGFEVCTSFDFESIVKFWLEV